MSRTEPIDRAMGTTDVGAEETLLTRWPYVGDARDSGRPSGTDPLLRPMFISRRTLVVDSLVTVFFGNLRYGSVGGHQSKIDQMISRVAETSKFQIAEILL